jgi:hypothetical protein
MLSLDQKYVGRHLAHSDFWRIKTVSAFPGHSMKDANPNPDSISDPFLSRGDIVKLIGCSGTSLNVWVRDGRFPQPDANLFGRRMWLASTVAAWRRKALDGQFSRKSQSFFRARQAEAL